MDLFIEFFIELFIYFPTFTIFQEKDDMTIDTTLTDNFLQLVFS